MKRFNEMVNFTYDNCTCPKMFVALKSACANKKGWLGNFKFLKSTKFTKYMD